DRIDDEVGRGMRAEADEAAATLTLEPARGFETASFFQRPAEKLRVVDAVEREQIDVIELQVAHRFFERRHEFLRRREWPDLRLHDHFLARQLWQNPTELHFAAPVSARGLDVINAELERAQD